MLLMFAVGVTNLFWMLALALVMFTEKVTRLAGPIGTATGVTLVTIGLIGLLRPEALGPLF
jgi:predicted metal-binding membrane protein